MLLFDNFEAVIFQQENKILVTSHGVLEYVYNMEYDFWKRSEYEFIITVKNYQEIDEQVLRKAMNGIMPTSEIDFIKVCSHSTLRLRDMLEILCNDYCSFMENYEIYSIINILLGKSGIKYKSFDRIVDLLSDAENNNWDYDKIIKNLKALSYEIKGIDLFKEEIEIVDGHDGSSYFWIKPARIIDWSNTNDEECVYEMQSNEISIEEDVVNAFLKDYLYKYFDDNLLANKSRYEYSGEDEYDHIKGFEWNLTYNFYEYNSMENIIKDIKDTVDALITGRNNEYTKLLEDKIYKFNERKDLIIDFYSRFIYRMEYMIRVGKENGCNLISFMGP